MIAEADSPRESLLAKIAQAFPQYSALCALVRLGGGTARDRAELQALAEHRRRQLNLTPHEILSASKL